MIIPRSDSVDAAWFFIDMEKLFGSETTIKELEEDDSEMDENDYNNKFMEDLKKDEINYRKNHKPADQEDHITSKFKSSYTKNIYQGKIKPFSDLKK